MPDFSGVTAQSLYVPGFKANLNLAPQQTTTRLLPYVDSDMNYSEKGLFFNADDIGTSDPEDITTRVPDSPGGFVDAQRRMGQFKPFGDGKFIDNEDLARQLEDPTNLTMMAMRAGLARKRETSIIGGLQNAYYYYDQNQNIQLGQTLAQVGNIIAANDAEAHEAETIAAVQQAATGGYGLTLGKLIEVKSYLDAAEIGEMEPDSDNPYIFACTANQIRDLQKSVPATSAFYNDVKLLASGKLNALLGFKFVRLGSNKKFNPLPKANYTRSCFAFHPRAIMYRARPILNDHVVQRSDKSFRWYAYYESDHGAVRHYDEGVWQVNCDEKTNTPYT